MEEGGGPAPLCIQGGWGVGEGLGGSTYHNTSFFLLLFGPGKASPSSGQFFVHSVREKNAPKFPKIFWIFKRNTKGFVKRQKNPFWLFFAGKEGTKARQFWNSGVLLVLGKKRQRNRRTFSPTSERTAAFSLLPLFPRNFYIFRLSRKRYFPSKSGRKKGICILHPKKQQPGFHSRRIRGKKIRDEEKHSKKGGSTYLGEICVRTCCLRRRRRRRRAHMHFFPRNPDSYSIAFWVCGKRMEGRKKREIYIA